MCSSFLILSIIWNDGFIQYQTSTTDKYLLKGKGIYFYIALLIPIVIYIISSIFHLMLYYKALTRHNKTELTVRYERQEQEYMSLC